MKSPAKPLLDAPMSVLMRNLPSCRSLGTSSNADFCSDIAKWTFHERGVLQAQNLQHRVVGGGLQPERYRVGDDVEFMVDIYLCEEGACRPYK